MQSVTFSALLEQCFQPPRDVEVERNGRWWPGVQAAWRACDDGRGRMAEVVWVELHAWGTGTYRTLVRPERVRLRDGSPA